MPHVMDATPLPAGTNFVGRELGLWRGFTIDDAYNLVLLSNNKPICRGPCSDRALAEGDEGVIGRAAYDVGCLKLRMAVLDEGSGRVCFLAAPASGNKLASYEEDLIHVWDFI